MIGLYCSKHNLYFWKHEGHGGCGLCGEAGIECVYKRVEDKKEVIIKPKRNDLNLFLDKDDRIK